MAAPLSLRLPPGRLPLALPTSSSTSSIRKSPSLSVRSLSASEGSATSAPDNLPHQQVTPLLISFHSTMSTFYSSNQITQSTSACPASQRTQVLVKAPQKSRLVLRFLWMESNLGLAVDQVVPGHGTIPVTPYYFWPMDDAWDGLHAQLRRPWIPKKRRVQLLNQATDLINLWQQTITPSPAPPPPPPPN